MLSGKDAAPLKVVTTFPILESWVKSIGGPDVEVYSLVHARGSVHSYEPLPRDIKMLQQADLVIGIGLGLEYWLNDLHQSASDPGPLVLLSDGMPRREIHDGHDHGSEFAYDPHLWMDPDIAIMMVTVLGEILAEQRPAAAESIFTRVEDWTWEVRDADFEIKKQLGAWKPEQKRLLSHHQNLDYWANHYGFSVVGSVLHSVSSHHEDPSAREIAALIRLLRKEPGVILVFTDNENPAVLKQLSRETSAPVAGPLFAETLPASEETPPRNAYADLLRRNATLVRQALESTIGE